MAARANANVASERVSVLRVLHCVARNPAMLTMHLRTCAERSTLGALSTEETRMGFHWPYYTLRNGRDERGNVR